MRYAYLLAGLLAIGAPAITALPLDNQTTIQTIATSEVAPQQTPPSALIWGLGSDSLEPIKTQLIARKAPKEISQEKAFQKQQAEHAKKEMARIRGLAKQMQKDLKEIDKRMRKERAQRLKDQEARRGDRRAQRSQRKKDRDAMDALLGKQRKEREKLEKQRQNHMENGRKREKDLLAAQRKNKPKEFNPIQG